MFPKSTPSLLTISLVHHQQKRSVRTITCPILLFSSFIFSDSKALSESPRLETIQPSPSWPPSSLFPPEHTATLENSLMQKKSYQIKWNIKLQLTFEHEIPKEIRVNLLLSQFDRMLHHRNKAPRTLLPRKFLLSLNHCFKIRNQGSFTLSTNTDKQHSKLSFPFELVPSQNPHYQIASSCPGDKKIMWKYWRYFCIISKISILMTFYFSLLELTK